MSDAKTVSVDLPVQGPRALRRKWRKIWRWPLVLLAVMVFLIFDLRPTVQTPRAPSAEQADATRLLAQRTRDAIAASKGRTTLFLSANDLTSATALASWLGSFGRFQAALAPDSLNVTASRQVLGPLWVNVSAVVSANKQGFPPVALRVGRVPLGQTISRWIIDTARSIMIARGVRVPPLDDLVNGVVITPETVFAQVYFPPNSGVSGGVAGLRFAPVDARAAARIYCRLVLLNQRSSATEFSDIVNQAFAPQRTTLNLVEANRAAFVGLAAYTTGSGAMRLADGMQKYAAAACPVPRSVTIIVGRDDLPKHWSLSAALAVAVGDDVSTAMGEWKELSDSRPAGSGFSFVDLAADRSGVAAALGATDPARAEAVSARLRRATSEDVLPIRALALSEGLSEAEFITRYGTIDSEAFARTKARIDRVIAKTAGE